MSDLRFTLISDGSSDRALLPALHWVLRQHSTKVFAAEWPDFGRLRHPPRTLGERIATALKLAPCDLLFVHRDAERVDPDARRAEIATAARDTGGLPAVPVVPVRMTEAWLLWHEAAIRRAAGNPRGRDPLHLPAPVQVERRPDPKADLVAALRTASGLRARRRAKTSTELRLIADAIDDFAPLRAAPAFARLEADVEHVVRSQGW